MDIFLEWARPGAIKLLRALCYVGGFLCLGALLLFSLVISGSLELMLLPLASFLRILGLLVAPACGATLFFMAAEGELRKHPRVSVAIAVVLVISIVDILALHRW